ncbi:hypothetical protein AB1K70_15545 [Bremerella sp. JC770]|uniref:hypothetical protein n=1 Tax=Bremerella sp. JC770 TaxID=3232137 RepID=UPI003457880F
MDRARKPIEWKRYSLRFLMIATAAMAVGLGIWKAVSYRHPAHANVQYGNADFTSGRSITVGPNKVAIRSIARNRYDGSIQILKGAGLKTVIPNAAALKQCCRWLDVVQVELEPGPERLGIVHVRIFHHDSRTIFEGNNGLGWQLVSPNIIQIYGLGTEVPERFDLWIQARSYPSDEVVRLEPRIGSEAKINGGSIKVVELQANYAGWNSRTGFLDGNHESRFSGPAVKLMWAGAWSEDHWHDVAAVAVDGTIDDSFKLLNLRFPWKNLGPYPFDIPLEAIDRLEIRPHVDDKCFFFDGLRVPPITARKFDLPPSVVRTVDEVIAGTTLDELAPLSITARVYTGTDIRPQYHPYLNTVPGQLETAVHPRFPFSLVLNENGSLYLPIDFHWRSNAGKQWRFNNLATGKTYLDYTENGMCKTKVYRESLEDLEAVKFVPRTR